MLKRTDISIQQYGQALDDACNYLQFYLSLELGVTIDKKDIRQLLLQDQGVRFADRNKFANSTNKQIER